MRTSIFIDDELGAQLKQAAKASGLSLSAFLANAGRRALQASPTKKKPFKLITYGSQGVNPDICLDRTSELIAAEDRETFRGTES
ncbi:MAG: hypothetical protein KDL10_02095 [Kiritimatiellae bacterium]|nr:hypothetical protein [Kiritimatiellia bacterium]